MTPCPQCLHLPPLFAPPATGSRSSGTHAVLWYFLVSCLGGFPIKTTLQTHFPTASKPCRPCFRYPYCSPFLSSLSLAFPTSFSTLLLARCLAVPSGHPPAHPHHFTMSAFCMPLPGTPAAPKFAADPSGFDAFFEDLSELAQHANLSLSDMIGWAGCYAGEDCVF